MERLEPTAATGTWLIVNTAHGTYLGRTAKERTNKTELDLNEMFNEVHEMSTQVVPTPVPNNPGAINVAKECYVTPVHVTSHPTKMAISLQGTAITFLSDMETIDRDFYMMMIANSRNMHKGWQANRARVQLASPADLVELKGR